VPKRRVWEKLIVYYSKGLSLDKLVDMWYFKTAITVDTFLAENSV
jgi:hypothetical protein